MVGPLRKPLKNHLKFHIFILFFRDICGNLLGEGGSQMSNFLTSAVRASYSRVNHVISLKDYVGVEWNSLCWNMESSGLWKKVAIARLEALSHRGPSPLDFWNEIPKKFTRFQWGCSGIERVPATVVSTHFVSFFVELLDDTRPCARFEKIKVLKFWTSCSVVDTRPRTAV